MKELVAMWALVFGVLCLTAALTINTPTVYISHSQGDCVAVEPSGNCENLPERYNLVWVK